MFQGNWTEAQAAFRAHIPLLRAKGISWERGWEPRGYAPVTWDQAADQFDMAMDAQAGILATTPNSALPALLTTFIDPEVYEILFALNQAAEIFGEKRRGDWLLETALFPTVEHTGETTAYDDYSEAGRSGANSMWPQRQNFLFQVMKSYGEREAERAGLARINWVSEIDKAAAMVAAKFLNLMYFFGVSGLQNYGLLNDPALTAVLTPGVKANGGTAWIKSGAINASANEVYLDIQAMFLQLVLQTQGLVNTKSKLTLAMSPPSEVALTATNSFNVNVSELVKKNFPNLEVKTAVQYGVLSTSNPQGIAAGNLVQLIAKNIETQETGYCAFSEKMRAHKLIPQTSSFKQKVTSGGWGAVIRQPFGISQMLGV